MLPTIAVPQSPSEQPGNQPPKDDQRRADSKRLNEILLEYIHRWETNLKWADPAAHIVELSGAQHYIFLSEEADLLRELHGFLKTLQ